MSGIELIAIAGIGVISSFVTSVYHIYKLKKIHAMNKTILNGLQPPQTANEPVNDQPRLQFEKLDTPTQEDLREMKPYYNIKTQQIEHYYECPMTARNGKLVPKLNI